MAKPSKIKRTEKVLKRQRFLSVLERKLCEGIVQGKTIAQASIDAGYSPRTASPQASAALKRERVQAYLEQLHNKVQNTAVVDVAYVINGLKTVAQRCLQGEPVLDKDGNETGQWKFDAAGANRALELLGKTRLLNVFGPDSSTDEGKYGPRMVFIQTNVNLSSPQRKVLERHGCQIVDTEPTKQLPGGSDYNYEEDGEN